MESALYSVHRDNFYSIDKFDLNAQVSITFEAKGNFTAEPQDWIKKSANKGIHQFLIRTAFSSCVLKPLLRKKAFTSAQAKHELEKGFGKRLFDHKEAIAKTSTWETGNKGQNIFKFTSFQPEYLYQLYHDAVQKEYEESFQKKCKEEWTGFPEVFQVVMVASNILKHVFQEECLQPSLNQRIHDKQTSYVEAFGSIEESLAKAHFLEAPAGASE